MEFESFDALHLCLITDKTNVEYQPSFRQLFPVQYICELCMSEDPIAMGLTMYYQASLIHMHRELDK